ncbi:MAG: hypothetical protein Q8P18_32370 [Pseudomonadota bacterium]|nr:hypothetical protein [Pseudomonadota bacterium]
MFSTWVMLGLVACDDPGTAKPPDDTSDTAEEAVGCEVVAPPALSTDTWSPAGAVPANGLLTLATDGGAPIYAGSHNTGLWTSEDALVWDDLVVDITHTLAELALRPGDPRHVFRSAGGNLTRSLDGGATWEQLALGFVDASGPPDAVWAVATTPWRPDRLLALQRSGAATISTDDGDTFVARGYAPVHLPPLADDPFQTYAWRVLPEAVEGGRVVFGDGFGVAVSDDEMGAWTRTLDTPLGGYSLLRDPLDPAHLVAGGPDGLYSSGDEGSTWTLRDLGGDVILGAWAGDGSWLALVGSAAVYVSTDGGETFTTQAHAWHHPSAMALLDDGRLLLAHASGLVVSADRGVTWADAASGLEDRGMAVVVPHPTCASRVFTASRCGGGLSRSEDYGATWANVSHYFHYVMGLHFGASPSLVNRIWAVSDDRLLVSEDDGVTWEERYRRYHFHGFALHPDDPDVLLLGSVGSGEWADESARVYRSVDAGITWEDSSTGLPAAQASAHALVRWPGDPDVVLLGTYKGGDVSHLTGVGIGLWRSADGGASWAKAALDVDDIAGLVATADAMYAATGEGIWRSDDLGVTWTQMEGPTGPVLTLALHGDIGIALSGGDGTAWKSVDGGRTWLEHDAGIATNPSTTLAQAAISADGAVGYITVFDAGVWQIGL